MCCDRDVSDLIVLQKPGRRGRPHLAEIRPPPGLLAPSLLVIAPFWPTVLLKLIERVESFVVVQLWDVDVLQVGFQRFFVEDEVHTTDRLHLVRKFDTFHHFGVTGGHGTDDVNARGQESPVISIFSWTETKHFNISQLQLSAH